MSTGNVANVTEELDFYFHFMLIKIEIGSSGYKLPAEHRSRVQLKTEKQVKRHVTSQK